MIYCNKCGADLPPNHPIHNHKIGLTATAADLLHTGHIAMLAEAKSQCDKLIVALHTNPQLDRKDKNKPIQTTYERYMQLIGCKYVDKVIPYDTEEDLLNMLHIVQPDVRIVGEEYRDIDFTGKDLGIPIYYNRRRHNYGTRHLRNRIKNAN